MEFVPSYERGYVFPRLRGKTEEIKLGEGGRRRKILARAVVSQDPVSVLVFLRRRTSGAHGERVRERVRISAYVRCVSTLCPNARTHCIYATQCEKNEREREREREEKKTRLRERK